MAHSISNQSDPNTSPPQSGLAHYWNTLIEPPVSVVGPFRNQVRLLSGLLLAMISICLLSFISQVFLGLSGRPLPFPILLVTLGTTGALAFAYYSNKVGRYPTAAALTIIIINVGTWGVIVATPAALQINTLLLPFLVLPLVVCGALTTVSFTVAVVLINVAFVAFIHLVLPGRSLESLILTLFFVGTISALIIVNVIVRDRDRAEIDRQTKSLAESNAELQTNAAKLNSLFEVLPVGVSILNKQQQIVDTNPSLRHILNISNEGLAAGAYTGRKYIHPDGTPLQPDEFAGTQAVEKQKPVLDIETGVITETGETIWTSVSAAPLSLNELRAVVVTTDITGRKQAEEELRKLSRQDVEALRLAHMGRWEFDLTTAQFIFNDQYYTLHGTTAEAAGGYQMSAEKFASRYVHPDDGHIVGAAIQEAIEKNDPNRLIERNTRILRANGEIRDVLTWFRVEQDAQGRPARLVGVNQDITERKEADARFRRALDSAPDAIVIVNPNGTITLANAQTEKLFGYQREALLGQSIELLIPEPLRERHIEHRADYLTNPHTRPMGADLQLNCLRQDGTLVPVEISLSPLETAEGTLVMASIRDITERKVAEQLLNELNVRLANSVDALEQRSREISLLNEMGDQLQSCLNSDEAFSLISRFTSRLFPNTASAMCLINASRNIVEAVGTQGQSSTASILPIFKPQDCWGLRRGQPFEFHAGEFNQACYHFPGPPPQAYVCLPLVAQSETLGIFHLQMIEPLSTSETLFSKEQLRLAKTLADSASVALANLRLREKLSQQSIRDPLTDLFNRRYLEESLERELRRAARSKYPVGVMMLDLDHFKRFNDTFGHEAGDTVLREIGGFLSKHIRGGDIGCRYGGEEFTLILPEASLEITRQRAEQLCEDVRHLQVQNRDQSLGTITFSCGVAIFPDHGSSYQSILQAADAALYRAKRDGRDRVVVSN